MSDSAMNHPGDRIDRYARRELTAPEARELAQESLDDPELFEDLTSAALAMAALKAEQFDEPRSHTRIVGFARRSRIFVYVATAAAVVVLFSLYSLRQSRSIPGAPPAQNAPRLKPALASAAASGQPILLASDLQFEPDRNGGPQVFRGSDDSRAPQPTGSLVSIDDGLAAIDLGSVDGLAKGSEVQVFRDARSTDPIGSLEVTTVFRERARVRILSGKQVRIHDQVRAPAPAYLDALLHQVDALAGRGDSKAARAMAEKAAEWVKANHIPPDETRDASPIALNGMAVLLLLKGDYQNAEAPLQQALANSSKTDTIYLHSLNNLGVLAELRGDRRKAEELYTEAQRASAAVREPSAQDRQAVESNLARLRGSPQ